MSRWRIPGLLAMTVALSLAFAASAYATFIPIDEPDAAYVGSTTKIDISGIPNGTSEIGTITDGVQTVTFGQAVSKQFIVGFWGTEPGVESSYNVHLLHAGVPFGVPFTMDLSKPVIKFGFEMTSVYPKPVVFTVTFLKGNALVGSVTRQTQNDYSNLAARLFAISSDTPFDRIVILTDVDAGGLKIAQVRYSPAGTLRGTVTDATTGRPIAGALVDAGAAGTRVTGGDGTYEFAATLPGTYPVTCTKAGYLPLTVVDVWVVSGQTTVQDFAMIPAPAMDIEDLIDAVDDAVADGTLAGTGPGNSATGKLGAFENMLASAEASITAGDYAGALDQLKAAYAKCDGNPLPPDLVTGDARVAIAAEILALIAKLEAMIP